MFSNYPSYLLNKKNRMLTKNEPITSAMPSKNDLMSFMRMPPSYGVIVL